MEKYTRRDILARDRTHLANERTLLAYWRTAFALIVLGAFLIKFLDSQFTMTATIAIVFGVFLFVFGTIRFFHYKNKINKR